MIYKRCLFVKKQAPAHNYKQAADIRQDLRLPLVCRRIAKMLPFLRSPLKKRLTNGIYL